MMFSTVIIINTPSLSPLICYGLEMTYGKIDVANIGSGNGLLPDGTKLLPYSMLTSHQRDSEGSFIRYFPWYESENYWFKITAMSPGGQQLETPVAPFIKMV